MRDDAFRTYDQMIKKLRDEKGMDVPDEARVIELLKKHGYFGLVSGYKEPFKQPNRQYLKGTTIDDLLALYDLDTDLREVFLHGTLIIEQHIKSLLSYAFVHYHGSHERDYLNPEHYIDPHDNHQLAGDIKHIIALFERTGQDDRYQYIVHQRRRYNNVPLGIMLKAITMGYVSNFYDICTLDVRENVSNEFPNVSPNELSGMLDFVTQVRNICAHNERLYHFRATKGHAIRGMQVHDDLHIRKDGSFYTCGQKDLFACFICFYYLLGKEDFLGAAWDIAAAVDRFCSRTNLVSRRQILSVMGFPENWLEIREMAEQK